MCWVVGRKGAKCCSKYCRRLQPTGESPTAKNCPAPNVKSTVTTKLRFGLNAEADGQFFLFFFFFFSVLAKIRKDGTLGAPICPGDWVDYPQRRDEPGGLGSESPRHPGGAPVSMPGEGSSSRTTCLFTASPRWLVTRSLPTGPRSWGERTCGHASGPRAGTRGLLCPYGGVSDRFKA